MGGAQDLGGGETAPYDTVTVDTGHQAFVKTRSTRSTKSKPSASARLLSQMSPGNARRYWRAVCAWGGARGHSALHTQFSVNLKLVPRKFVNLKKKGRGFRVQRRERILTV